MAALPTSSTGNLQLQWDRGTAPAEGGMVGRASASRDAAGLRSKLEWLWVAIPCIPPPDPAHPPRLLHVSPTAGTSAPALPFPLQSRPEVQLQSFQGFRKVKAFFRWFSPGCAFPGLHQGRSVLVIPHIRPHGELIPWPGCSHPRWIYSPLSTARGSQGVFPMDTSRWNIHSAWVGGEAFSTPCPAPEQGGFQLLPNPGSSRPSRALLGAQTEPLCWGRALACFSL